MSIDAQQAAQPRSIAIVRCAVPVPLYTLLDYSVPEGQTLPSLGCRVRVSVGRRKLVAVVMQLPAVSDVDPSKLRPIEETLDRLPIIDADQQALMNWCANYYLHPIGEVIWHALAPRERRGEPPAPTGAAGIRLNLRGQGLPAGALKRARKQAELLAALQQGPRTLTAIDALGISRATVRALLGKDLVERADIIDQSPWSSSVGLDLNSEQRKAVSASHSALGKFTCVLLEGITGSGKTEVYLQTIAKVLSLGQQALVLLPEIGLTPQMISRFKARFNAPVVVLHSALAEGERDRHWAMARNGEAAVIIGTRSAVFAPALNLGLIVVDEEHDASYSQQDGFRYSARDVAVKRGHMLGCPVLLGSATPSLESMANAAAGRYQHLALSSRAGGAKVPTVSIIDIRSLALDAGLSVAAIDALKRTMARGEQALIFLNRRGYAPSLQCHDCGWVYACEHCDARMTVHRQPAALNCHHCGARKPLPRECASCRSKALIAAGVGTEQLEQALARLLPTTPLYRVDSDTMTRRNAMDELRANLADSGPTLILGTQMLAKGHHFPKVTTVLVVDADSLLFNPDFRGEERLLQMLLQVGGRAGRGDLAGQVVIQTHHPEHPLIAQAFSQSYSASVQPLLAAREQQALPPFGALALLRCDGPDLQQAMGFLSAVKSAAAVPTDVKIIGPIPAAMARRAGLHRCQVVVSGRTRKSVHDAALALHTAAVAAATPRGLKWFVDIDPADAL